MLHPAGPEPAQTYWLRRVLVLLAILIVVLVSVGVATASMGATRKDATPAAASPSTSESPLASTSQSPTPSSIATPSATPSAASSTSSAPSTGKADSGSTAAVTPVCQPKDLKTTLTGKQMLKLNKPAAFTVTIRNGGDETCRVSLTRNDFELRVTSGKKVFWSSKVCTTATFVVAAKLDLDQSMSWPMVWDGRGVSAGCAQPGAELKRGTYLSTATVTGGKPAELPVTLRP